jgi:archaemetzincin
MIEIIPFNDVEKGILETVCEGVENVFGSCIISTTKLNIPEKAYHETRGQYLSEFFLEEIFDYSKRARATKILGITMVDLYTGNLNFIFGHAYMNGRIALISLHRLNPEFYGEKKKS